jgi:predicted acylesterase/phospholipase RssA
MSSDLLDLETIPLVAEPEAKEFAVAATAPSSEAEAEAKPKEEAEAPAEPKEEAEAPAEPKDEAEAPAEPKEEAEAPSEPKDEAEAPAEPKDEAEAPVPIKRKLWVVMPGGGIKSVFQAGFLKGFFRKWGDKVSVDRVYSSSLGSIFAPVIAAESFNTLEHCIFSIRDKYDVVSKKRWLSKEPGFYGKVKLVKRVADRLARDVSSDAVKTAHAKCHAVAWDIINKREKWFNGDDLPIGIRASSALSVVVPPIHHAGALYTDGCVTELIPMTKVISDWKALTVEEQKCVDILIVDCATREVRPLVQAPRTPKSYIIELFNDMFETLASQEDLDVDVKKDVPMAVVRPDSDLFESIIDVDRHKIKIVWDHGISKANSFKGFGST